MRYHTTTRPVLDDEGKQIGFEQIDVPFTAEEELEADQREAAYSADEPLRLAAAVREASKAARQVAVDAIKVTTGTGLTFDGDETSQTRMSRAIIGLQAAGVTTIHWTLADNSTVEVTAAELTEALILAGQEQARLWVL